MGLLDGKYIILEENAAFILESKVNKKIDQGYMPLGGVTIISRSLDFDKYVQAMVKVDD